MNRDPSNPEGLRTSSTSDRPGDPDRPTVARATLGWSLIVAVVLVGFGVGSCAGTPDDPADAGLLGSGPIPAVSAGAPGRTLEAPLALALAPKRGADDAPAIVSVNVSAVGVSGGVPVPRAAVTTETVVVAREVPEAGDSDAPIVLASLGGTRSIAKLPIYRANPKAASAESLTIVTRGKIASGESLGSSLQRQGISPGTVHLVATEMRKVFDFRHSRPGDEYRLGQDSDGRVLDFRYSQSAEESFYLAWNGTRYVVQKEAAELRPEMAKIAGIVDSSFYGAIVALGEQSALASEFARIFAWDIDFSRSVHPGDEFQILYERLYRLNDDGDNVYVRPGRILAGHYEGRNGEHTVVYFEGSDGGGAYFRPDGSSVERAFLVSPLESSRITSRFTWARQHPILKITRPHPGIDYAAPHGTPIWSVATGVVEYKARAGASGNLIRIRHQGGLTSHYAHLASFADGLKIGDRVEQKQIIGYVGSTGLSTGPHVCFRVKRDGQYVDPMKISAPAGEPVDVARLANFRSVRDQLLADLGPGPVHLSDEAL